MRLDGPPVTKELQQVFGVYWRGTVTGIAALQNGIKVEFAEGTTLRFVPVEELDSVSVIRYEQRPLSSYDR